MTLYQFNQLDEMEQAEAVWEGAFVADREDKEHKIFLYQIDSFYIEVYYHKDYNVIRRFKSFSSTEKLKTYLGEIELHKFLF